MSYNLIALYRKSQIQNILKKHELQGVLFINGIRENFDSWLNCSETIPILQPFGRMNLYFVTADGTVTPYCAIVNHPCDHPHYELFAAEKIEAGIRNNRLGIVNPECLLEITKKDLDNKYPDLEMVDLSRDFLYAKALKDRSELGCIENAARYFDRVFGLMPWILREGQTEAQAVVELRHRIGITGVRVVEMFDDPMATKLVDLRSAPMDGPAAEEPIVFPGRTMQLGDRINISVTSYLKGGFSAALGRCYVLGKATVQTRLHWDLALKAQDTAAAELYPGNTIENVVRVLNDKIYLTNGLPAMTDNCIYGIGYSRCEAPRNVDATRAMELEKGMTLVVAPKISFPGRDPYCCMDMYEITDNGARRLTKTERELVELT